MSQCKIPPPGWYCTRKKHHLGPCAAHPILSDRPLVAVTHPLQIARCAWVSTSRWDGLKKWFWLLRHKHWRGEWWNARPWA